MQEFNIVIQLTLQKESNNLKQKFNIVFTISCLQQSVTIKLKNIHLFKPYFLLYLQGIKIINRNLLGDESRAPENQSTVLLGTGRLKITMKHHMACSCAKITQAICNRAPQIIYIWLSK